MYKKTVSFNKSFNVGKYNEIKKVRFFNYLGINLSSKGKYSWNYKTCI